MKNKKSIKSKILVPALAVLALTTTASVTSTVAWFAANDTVTASSMSIKAVTEGNLFIAKGASIPFAQLTATSVTDLDVNATAVKPTSVEFASSKLTLKTPATWTAEPTVSTKGEPATYTKVAEVTASEETGLAVASATDPASKYKPGDYAAIAHVTIARKITTAAKYTLTPTVTVKCEAKALNPSLRVGWIINGKWAEASDKLTANDTEKEFKPTAAATLDDNIAYDVALVMYFDGNDDTCFINNAIDLSTYSASWSFKASV